MGRKRKNDYQSSSEAVDKKFAIQNDKKKKKEKKKLTRENDFGRTDDTFLWPFLDEEH